MEQLVNTIFNLVFDIVDVAIGGDYAPVVYYLKIVAALVSILVGCGIFYNVFKTYKIYKSLHISNSVPGISVEVNKNLMEWNKILEQGKSKNENDRKLAVIAADSLIEKILSSAGYSGENLGEKLKNIEPADLESLDALWVAHKVRNRIAHDVDYRIPREDAEQALALFQKTLKELEYI